jgi:hypothetical protein
MQLARVGQGGQPNEERDRFLVLDRQYLHLPHCVAEFSAALRYDGLIAAGKFS